MHRHRELRRFLLGASLPSVVYLCASLLFAVV